MTKRKARCTYRRGQLGSGGEMGGLPSVMAAAYRREDTKLVPGRAVIKTVRGQMMRRREGGGEDQTN